jgi:hypothetical protein
MLNVMVPFFAWECFNTKIDFLKFKFMRYDDNTYNDISFNGFTYKKCTFSVAPSILDENFKKCCSIIPQ